MNIDISFSCRRIAENLQEYIPNLDTLMLNNNALQELTDVDPLATLPKLVHVRQEECLIVEQTNVHLIVFSFARCPIAMKKDYRLYVIHALPHLRTLDHNRITQKVSMGYSSRFQLLGFDFEQERESARKLFKSKSGEKAKKKQKGANTFVPGGDLAKPQQQQQPQAPRMTKENADAIKVFIFIFILQL